MQTPSPRTPKQNLYGKPMFAATPQDSFQALEAWKRVRVQGDKLQLVLFPLKAHHLCPHLHILLLAVAAGNQLATVPCRRHSVKGPLAPASLPWLVLQGSLQGPSL